jgi:Lon-like ATP-dependent protease
VNGLSVYDLGYHRFGKPTRITASVSPGQAGIINIEREARLSGNIYDKGVLVISGWVRRCFARDAPLAFTASLAFEQSYAGVDGDSASIAEVVALLSEISGLPVLQSVAVTGSINQHGQVQAIGGVNEKIEGFHALCAARGLTGEQGVVVPEVNLQDLVLADAVTEDIRAGRFHLWAVTHVQEALEILLDRPGDAVMEEVRAGLDDLRRKTEATSARDTAPTPVLLPEQKPPMPGTGPGRGGPGTNDE